MEDGDLGFILDLTHKKLPVPYFGENGIAC